MQTVLLDRTPKRTETAAMRKPTISDLARVAGVSKTTVSHAYSERRHVDPETRKRIFAIAEEITVQLSGLGHLSGVEVCEGACPAAGVERLGHLCAPRNR